MIFSVVPAHTKPMFWADIVLNAENGSEDASAIVSSALLSVVFSHAFGG